MTRQDFEVFLRLTGCDENTVQFGLNAFDMGEEHGTYKSTNMGLFPNRSIRETSSVAGVPSEA